jgi:hypothetical protein
MALADRPKPLWKALAGLGALALCLAAWKPSRSAQNAGTSAISQTIFQFDQPSGLGAGAVLSPDGGTLVYRAKDDHLYAKTIATGQTRLLLKQTPSGLDVFFDPSFSRDGSQLVFSASGPTYYYPSDIYRIGLDGSGLTRLTHSVPFPEGVEPPAGGNWAYARYFYSAQYSPDGSRILVDAYDAVHATDNVAVMAADGSGLSVLAQGKPLGWSGDGQGIYHSHGGAVEKYDLATRSSGVIAGLSPDILGRVAGKDWFAVNTAGNLALFSVEGSAAYSRGSLDVPLAQATPREQLDLTSIQWTVSGRVLLLYEGETTERLQVILLNGP